jgi:hypothetical protein
MNAPMERYPYFVEQVFQIFSANVFLRSVPEFLKHFATSGTRFRVNASKRDIVVAWFEIVLLLLAQLESEVGQNRYICGVRRVQTQNKRTRHRLSSA